MRCRRIIGGGVGALLVMSLALAPATVAHAQSDSMSTPESRLIDALTDGLTATTTPTYDAVLTAFYNLSDEAQAVFFALSDTQRDVFVARVTAAERVGFFELITPGWAQAAFFALNADQRADFYGLDPEEQKAYLRLIAPLDTGERTKVLALSDEDQTVYSALQEFFNGRISGGTVRGVLLSTVKARNTSPAAIENKATAIGNNADRRSDLGTATNPCGTAGNPSCLSGIREFLPRAGSDGTEDYFYVGSQGTCGGQRMPALTIQQLIYDHVTYMCTSEGSSGQWVPVYKPAPTG